MNFKTTSVPLLLICFTAKLGAWEIGIDRSYVHISGEPNYPSTSIATPDVGDASNGSFFDYTKVVYDANLGSEQTKTVNKKNNRNTYSNSIFLNKQFTEKYKIGLSYSSYEKFRSDQFHYFKYKYETEQIHNQVFESINLLTFSFFRTLDISKNLEADFGFDATQENVKADYYTTGFWIGNDNNETSLFAKRETEKDYSLGFRFNLNAKLNEKTSLAIGYRWSNVSKREFHHISAGLKIKL